MPLACDSRMPVIVKALKNNFNKNTVLLVEPYQ